MTEKDSIARAPEGRRDRKARELRAKLMAIAWQLFQERGYEQVTLAQIAEMADIAPRTLSNHFRSKEELVTSWQDEGSDQLLAKIAQRPPSEDGFAAATNGLIETVAAIPSATLWAAYELVERTPVLRARDKLKSSILQVRVAEVLAARDPRQSNDLARIDAMLAFGANDLARTQWAESGGRMDPAQCLRNAVAAVRMRALDLGAGEPVR